MDKLKLYPNISDASKIDALWKRQVYSCTEALAATGDEKLNLLINRLDYTVYEYIEDLTTINEAFAKLDQVFGKRPMLFLQDSN